MIYLSRRRLKILDFPGSFLRRESQSLMVGLQAGRRHVREDNHGILHLSAQCLLYFLWTTVTIWALWRVHCAAGRRVGQVGCQTASTYIRETTTENREVSLPQFLPGDRPTNEKQRGRVPERVMTGIEMEVKMVLGGGGLDKENQFKHESEEWWIGSIIPLMQIRYWSFIF